MSGTLSLSTKLSPFPYAALAIATYTAQAEATFDEGITEVALDFNGSKVVSEDEIVQTLAKAGGLADDSAKSQAFFAVAKKIPAVTAVPELLTVLDSLDDHLAFRTFLIGHDITAADFMIWGAIKASVKILGLLKNNKHPHLARHLAYIESLPTTTSALALLTAEKASGRRSNKVAASFALGLQNAVDGQVVTRFPPEPSGYLHIGHAKAALLNQYFAKMYHGKMLIRFDDTNPTKERSEFEETILEDLALLDIHGDAISHTSDYFDTLYDLCIKMIETGKAYADDTVQEQMRAERMDGIASKHRDDSVADNLQHFAEMKAGTAEGLRWCIRAKISVDNPNKAMRDPVIYRCNILTHHRTGDKWKIYPTYDFACPVVDSLEGVTHALRTNEYRDRNAQYYWMIDALGVRRVEIWDFSRLNFIYTLLSKRKLHWFVDNGLVKGWDDPRFPTVRGIRRRGMTVEALRQFMLLQGPSQAIVSLEWDSIWAINKKVIDPVAPRFWAVAKDKLVPVMIKGGPETPEVKAVPKHKKNPEVGEKQTVYASQILLEQEDALSFAGNEEITLMDWGNAILTSKTVDASGTVTALTMDLNLAGDFRKTSKKIHWLPQLPGARGVIPVTLLDYDYLITKKKLDESDELADYVTPVTEFREEALADANILSLNKGDIIQFERKGYFILDTVFGEGEQRRMEFIKIPDGKAAGLASKAGAGPVGAKAGEKASSSTSTTTAFEVPVETKMYKMPKVYGEDDAIPTADTKMYAVKNVYSS